MIRPNFQFYIIVNTFNDTSNIQRIQYASGYSEERHDYFFEDFIETIDFKLHFMGSSAKIVIVISQK